MYVEKADCKNEHYAQTLKAVDKTKQGKRKSDPTAYLMWQEREDNAGGS